MFALEPALRRPSQPIMSEEGDDLRPKSQREHVEGNLKLCEPKLELDSEVMCVRFSPDGSIIAIGQANGIIKIFNPTKPNVVHKLVPPQDVKESHLPVTSIRFRPNTRDDKIEHSHVLIATYASGYVRQWHYTSGKCVASFKEQGEKRQTLCCSIDHTGSRLVTGADDAKLHLYDPETLKAIHTLEASDSRDDMDGHMFRVFSVQYHPTQRHLLVSGGWDDTVHFWDDRRPHSIRKFYGPHISGDSLDIDAAHNHIVTGSWRKEDTIQIWDFVNGQKIKDVPQDPMQGSLLYCCQWLGKDSIVCGGTDANMARVIDRGTLNTVGTLVDLPHGVFSIDNDRQGLKPKIAVGASNTCYIIQTERKQ